MWTNILEQIETVKTETEGREILGAMKLQDGYKGGRYLPGNNVTPERVQLFWMWEGQTQDEARSIGMNVRTISDSLLEQCK